MYGSNVVEHFINYQIWEIHPDFFLQKVKNHVN